MKPYQSYRQIAKIAKVCLVASALSGCALPIFDNRPPWQRITPTHTPLMYDMRMGLGHNTIVSTADPTESQPIPNWP